MNQMNPMKLLQLKNAWDQFKSRHPKFLSFINSVTKGAVSEGSVIEITVTTADGQTINSNLLVTAEDMQLIEDMKELFLNQP